jgi:hypothetical protein
VFAFDAADGIIFCQNQTHLLRVLPKSYEGDRISSQVQIITMIRNTVDCREKGAGGRNKKAMEEAASSAACMVSN